MELSEIDCVVKVELGLSLLNPFPPVTAAVFFGLGERIWKESSMFQHPNLNSDGLCNLEIHF